jgi:glc operon protein GlcG
MSLESLPTKKILTLEWARRIGEAAHAAAIALKLDSVVVTVVDDAGILLYLLRQDGAEPAAVDIGIAKARTAAIFRRATKHWKETLLEGKLWVLGMPNMTPIEGGQPIVANGKVIGAPGVAGASGALDTQIGSAALAVLARGTAGDPV